MIENLLTLPTVTDIVIFRVHISEISKLQCFEITVSMDRNKRIRHRLSFAFEYVL